MINIGERIKIARLKKGWSQEKLGEKLGVEGATVSRWESGKYEPSPEMVPKLINLIDLVLDDKKDGLEFSAQDSEALGIAIQKEIEKGEDSVLRKVLLGVVSQIDRMQAETNEVKQSVDKIDGAFTTASGRRVSLTEIYEKLLNRPQPARDFLLSQILDDPSLLPKQNSASKGLKKSGQ